MTKEEKTRDIIEKMQELELMKKIPFQEALRAVYVPIVLTQSAFDYTKAAVQSCARLKLPYKRECRRIKEEMTTYEQETFQAIGREVMQELLERKYMLNDKASSSYNNLWVTLSKKEKQFHPGMGDELRCMCVNALIALLLYRYSLKYQAVASEEIKRKTGRGNDLTDEHAINIVNELINIVREYKIDTTPTLTRSVRAIARKIDQLTEVRIKDDKKR